MKEYFCYLLLGSNIENRVNYLEKATQFIENQIGRIEKKSQIYESEPWGFQADKKFLNQVLCVKTSLIALEVLFKIQKIENDLGRIRNFNSQKQYESRTIDIDILFYDKFIVYLPILQVPHPQVQNRKFALLPLAEIAPNFIHPTILKTISQLLENCTDTLIVKPF